MESMASELIGGFELNSTLEELINNAEILVPEFWRVLKHLEQLVRKRAHRG